MDYIIGVDGGGTKTTCLLADSEGNVYAQSQNGPSNYQAVGLGTAVEVIHRAVVRLVDQSKATDLPVKTICLGLAGVDTPQDAELITREVTRLNIASHVYVVNDTEIALIGGAGEKRGIVVVGGTGSAAYGCDDHGQCAHAGGWGWILGDEGSAFYIGQKGLQATVRALEGRGEATCLIRCFQSYWKLGSEEELVCLLRGRTWTRSDVASLAEVVALGAREGDQIAQTIMRQAAEELALLVKSVYQRLCFKSEFNLVLSGGVFQAKELVIEPLQQSVASFAPEARLTLPRYPSVLGAVFLAAQKMGRPWEAGKMEKALSQLVNLTGER